MKRYEEHGAKFLAQSQTENPSPSASERGKERPNYLSTILDENRLIPLPDAQAFTPINNHFSEVLLKRRTARNYDLQVFLSLEELSWLLWTSQGIKSYSEKAGITTRNVPSAGSRHPFETYLAVQRVDTLTPGLYHYIAQKHALELVNPDLNVLTAIGDACYRQKQVANAAVNFIWVAEVYRTSYRYQERAYRYLFLDAGHVCQNLHLACESINYGLCSIGAYKDNEANAAVGVDGLERFVIYLASVGKPLPQANA